MKIKTRILEKTDSAGSYFVPQVEQLFGLFWMSTHQDYARFRSKEEAIKVLDNWLLKHYPKVVHESTYTTVPVLERKGHPYDGI